VEVGLQLLPLGRGRVLLDKIQDATQEFDNRVKSTGLMVRGAMKEKNLNAVLG
jgi:hypothetical protein